MISQCVCQPKVIDLISVITTLQGDIWLTAIPVQELRVISQENRYAYVSFSALVAFQDVCLRHVHSITPLCVKLSFYALSPFWDIVRRDEIITMNLSLRCSRQGDIWLTTSPVQELRIVS